MHSLAGVVQMPPLSMADIEIAAEAFLEEYAPEGLQRLCRLDVLRLVDVGLQQRGVNVIPASIADMRGAEGLTLLNDQGAAEIWIELPQWEALEKSGPRAFRARGTVCHEIGHVILHLNEIRRRLARAAARAPEALQRVSPRDIKPYENSEWQAWAFAGCILMPRRAVLSMRLRYPHEVSRIFETSIEFAKAHMRRLHIPAAS